MPEPIYLPTPVGRFVMGDCFVGDDTDHTGRPRVDKQGRPKMQWFVALACPKGDEFNTFWAQVQQKAQMDFPGGECQSPTFAWKYEDGDSPKHAGKDGFAGCWILKMQSGFAPTIYDNTEHPQVINDPNAIKRGYFLQFQISVVGNGEPATGKPGIYVNGVAGMLMGYGAVITSGPSPEEMFAKRGALPPGASATPLPAAQGVPGGTPPQQAGPGVLPAGPVTGVAGTVPAQPMPGMGPSVPGATGAPSQPGAVAPAPGFLNPQGQQ